MRCQHIKWPIVHSCDEQMQRVYTVVSVFKTTLDFKNKAMVIVCQIAVSFGNADSVRSSWQHCNSSVTFCFLFREILFENWIAVFRLLLSACSSPAAWSVARRYVSKIVLLNTTLDGCGGETVSLWPVCSCHGLLDLQLSELFFSLWGMSGLPLFSWCLICTSLTSKGI